MTATTQSRSPKVSIIIPAYNTAQLIPDCLNSVLAQSYTDYEAIVVNDGSPDTPELERALGPYRDRIVYIEQENKRAAGARNTAIQRARGEFLAFLDSDDSWLPDHLAAQMALFDQSPALDLVYSDALIIGDPKHQWKFMDRCPSHGDATFSALAVERCQIPISTVVARKSALVKAGLFDENLPRCDDYDMWLRAAFHGARVGYSTTVQARLAGGRPGSLGQSRSKMSEAYWKILEKTLSTLPLSASDRQLIKNRSVEIRAAHILEEAKNQIVIRQFPKARNLLCEANVYFRRPLVTLAILGLGVAPSATAKLIWLWTRVRNGPAV